MDRYQVVGNPIAHSKSPQIHRAFAQQLGHKIEYGKLCLDAEQFCETLSTQLRSGEILGSNVTLPFKELASDLAEVRSPRVALSGAANTLYMTEEGLIAAENTDGPGLVRDLQQHLGFDLNDARVLLLGAGGAVRGVLLSLLDAGVSKLVLANRTISKAEEIKKIFDDERIEVSTLELEGLGRFDLIINGTSASLSGTSLNLPDPLLGPKTLAYDLVYGAEMTPFCVWAKERGARASDGLGMLVEQAAESFKIWRGVRPDTAPVLDEMRKALSLR